MQATAVTFSIGRNVVHTAFPYYDNALDIRKQRWFRSTKGFNFLFLLTIMQLKTKVKIDYFNSRFLH